jgi:hypothetical protein
MVLNYSHGKFLAVTTFLFLIMGCQSNKMKGPRFAIFLVEKPAALLENIELAKTPLLTDADIVLYEWEEHTIFFSDEGFKKLPASRQVGVSGMPFVVVVDDKRCYLGAFWTGVSSLTHPNPVIDVLRAENNSVTIQRAYPSGQFGKGDDPRPDKRLLKTLTELKKISRDKSKVLNPL